MSPFLRMALAVRRIFALFDIFLAECYDYTNRREESCLQPLCEKIFLQLMMPTDDDSLSDHERIREALHHMGYQPVTFPLHILSRLYPLCRESDFQITVSLVYRETEWVIAEVEPGDRTSHHYGLAVDYGSTTVVMQLVDLHSGAILDEVKEVNRQTRFGTDILTRITYSLEDPAHIDDLQKVTVETVDSLLEQLTERTGIDAKKCPVMVISGNTTMIHFLLKLNTWTVFASPFAPITTDPGWLWGREVGMDFFGMLYIIPAASNYIGGDIVSGLLKANIHKREETCMFFDIGTNGELVIGNSQWLIAGAGAAGPALEGYISRYGMRAAPGAVDTVRIQGRVLSFTTIGGQKPVGICGSGIIDLLAQMRLNGWVSVSGELDPTVSERICYLAEERQYAAVYATAEESASGEPLFFTQTDIMQYLDTKAAAYTMVDCLLEAAGCTAQDLAHCYLSGAFSAHSNLESAITIGMFPDLDREKYTAISNTSLEGARILLLDHSQLSQLHELTRNMYCIQFASIPDFLVRMQAAKFIPHTDMSRYPSVIEKLKKL